MLNGLEYLVIDRGDARQEVVAFRVLPDVGDDCFVNHDGATAVLDFVELRI